MRFRKNDFYENYLLYFLFLISIFDDNLGFGDESLIKSWLPMTELHVLLGPADTTLYKLDKTD